MRNLMANFYNLFLHPFKECFSYRYVIFQISKQSYLLKYRRSFLNLFWIIIMPLFYTLLFVFLKSNKILLVKKTNYPYWLYLFQGLVIWQMFANIISNSSNILAQQYRLTNEANFPKEIIIYGNTLPELLNAIILLVISLFVSSIFMPISIVGALFSMMMLLLVFLFGCGIAKIVSLSGAITQDMQRIVNIMLTIWLFATPAIYNPSSKHITILHQLNPMNAYINIFRANAFNTTLIIPYTYYIHIMIAILTFIVASYIFRKSIPLIIERL